jgi:ABC-type glutathione transport system ATPase component
VSANGRLLEVDELVVHYPVGRGIVGTMARRPRETVRAVDGVSFTLERGELLALVGESGCGKTTTAQTVLRLLEPVGGRITFHGDDITSLGQRELRPLRRRMQIVYQDPYESLDPRLTVRKAVEEPLLIHRAGGSKAERAELVQDALERVELSPPGLFLDRYPHELSGGQRQRVAIARALMAEPDVLLLDEPTSALDVSVQAEVLNLLSDLQQARGLTYVLVSHNLAVVAHLCDRIGVMQGGELVELLSSDDLRAGRTKHLHTAALRELSIELEEPEANP